MEKPKPCTEREYRAYLDQLIEFIAIPSVSRDPERSEDCARAARWLADAVGASGRNIELIPHDPHPVVYGEMGSMDPDAPAVLVYGHYDVVSEGATSQWHSPAFRADKRNGFLYGRGAADMKGPLLASLFAAIRAVEAAGDEYPWKIILLFEGAEEGGSWSIRKIIEQHPERMKANFAFSADAGMYSYNQPSLTLSVKALCAVNFRITGMERDQHSGTFGGAIDNPNRVMAGIIAGLHNKDGSITVEGMYNDVPEITDEQRRDLEILGMDEEHFCSGAGVKSLWGEAGYSPAERVFHRPSLTVTYMEGGQPMNIIPAKASAMVSVRLVPGQDEKRALAALEAHLMKACPPHMTLEITGSGSYPGAWIDRSHFGVQALSGAMERHFSRRPLMVPGGGGIPVIAYMQQILGIPSVLTGIAAVEDNIHGADERIHLENWRRSIDSYADFFSMLPEAEPA